MKLNHLLIEKEKKEKEQKIVFVETNPQNPFPDDTISALRKEINKLAKDLKTNWESPKQLLETAFSNLNVPIPQAFQIKRFKQYVDLISYAINNLIEARGFTF